MAKDWRSSVAEANKPAAATDPVEQARRRAKRRREIFLVLFLMMTLLGAVAAGIWLLNSYPQPYFLAIPVVEYKEPEWPINPLAEQDGYALQPYFLVDEKRLVAIESQPLSGLVKQLDELRVEHRRNTVVFHLCALARTVPNKSGPPSIYLIPGDASPDDKPDHWLNLEAVLDAMRACPAKNKLLILDIARAIADPRVGVLTNDVADHLQDRLEKLQQQGELPFAVLTPCARDQHSLLREDYRMSAFAYFLAEGCRGKADGKNPERRTNSRVSLRELHTYVAEEVKQWAARFRNAQQTPLLYGQFEDFDLVILEQAKAALPPLPPPAPVPYPQWLWDGWRLHDEWWLDGSYREAPRAFIRLEAALLRAEQRWRGGLGGDERRAQIPLDIVPELQREVKQVHDRARPQPRSLAQEKARGLIPDEETLRQLQGELLKPAEEPKPGDKTDPKDPKDPKDSKDPKDPKAPPKAAPPKEPERKKAPQEIVKSLTEKWQPKRPFDRAHAVVAFVRETSKDDLTTERLEILRRLLERSPDRLNTRYAETLCLHRLIELRTQIPTLEADKIQQVMRITDKCEAALAADARTLSWFRPTLQALSERRYAAEANLFQESEAKAEAALKELDSVGQDFDAVLEQVRSIQNAYLIYDEMFSRLPAQVAYLAERPRANMEDVQRWVKSIERLEALQRELFPKTADADRAALMEAIANKDWARVAELTSQLAAAVDRINQHVEKIVERQRGDRDTLRKPFEKENYQEFQKNQEEGKPMDYLELLALFDSPRIYAAHRERLWELSQWYAQNVKPRASEELASEYKRAAMRARMSIALLHLGGFDGANALLREWERVNKNTNADNAAWAPLAEQLRLAWSRELPDQLTKTHDLLAADRLLRIFPPWDRPNSPIANPAGELHKDQSRKFARFLTDLYDKQRSSAAANSPAETYYADSERTYRPFAGPAQ